MRRLVVGLSTVLLLIAGFPPAAQADSTVLVTGHGTGEFDYFEGTSAWAAGFNCEVFPVQGQAFFRVEQDTPPPPLGLGTRSWGFTPQFGATGRFYGVGVDVASSSGLDNFGMQVYGAAPSTGRAMIFAVPPGTITNGYYLGTATVGGGGDAWTPVNAANLSYAWAEYNSESTPTGVSGGTKTLDAFVTATGESTAGYRGILGFGCDGETFLYDGFKYGRRGQRDHAGLRGLRHPPHH